MIKYKIILATENENQLCEDVIEADSQEEAEEIAESLLDSDFTWVMLVEPN